MDQQLTTICNTSSPLTAHSLRAGLITTAAADGCDLPLIQQQSRHKSISVLMGYVRPKEIEKRNVLHRVGL